jgi:hypothetical protein
LPDRKCRRVAHLIGIGDGIEESVVGRAIVALEDSIERVS